MCAYLFVGCLILFNTELLETYYFINLWALYCFVLYFAKVYIYQNLFIRIHFFHYLIFALSLYINILFVIVLFVICVPFCYIWAIYSLLSRTVEISVYRSRSRTCVQNRIDFCRKTSIGLHDSAAIRFERHKCREEDWKCCQGRAWLCTWNTTAGLLLAERVRKVWYIETNQDRGSP